VGNPASIVLPTSIVPGDVVLPLNAVLLKRVIPAMVTAFEREWSKERGVGRKKPISKTPYSLLPTPYSLLPTNPD